MLHLQYLEMERKVLTITQSRLKRQKTTEENIRIWAEYNEETMAEDNFIVFSFAYIKFKSSISQHKDTTAFCYGCGTQTGVPYPHNTFRKDHISFLSACKHCAQQCARCCLYHLFGKSQDYYKATGTFLVMQNHGIPLDEVAIIGYSHFSRISPVSYGLYDSLYKTLRAKQKFFAGRGTHLYIVHGCLQNKPDGTITKFLGNPSWILAGWSSNSTTSQDLVQGVIDVLYK